MNAVVRRVVRVDPTGVRPVAGAAVTDPEAGEDAVGAPEGPLVQVGSRFDGPPVHGVGPAPDTLVGLSRLPSLVQAPLVPEKVPTRPTSTQRHLRGSPGKEVGYRK